MGEDSNRLADGWGEEPLPPWDTLFGYDRWANERWIAFARSHKWTAGDDVIEHIVRASEIWLSRVHREEPPDPAAETLERRLAACHERWLQTLRSLPPDEIIRYANLAGVQYETALGDIAAHVVNHGTYHRGQLRERAEADGFNDFPETDLILFFRETKRTSSL
ncbi:MAG: hypothetical protein KatS3mg015_1087 [Fimbriimonadales bacterium]|nr:MAG: hypothetical protein KatS3mg015_1087 [Fimbriimonadales bacterium]